MSTKTNEFAKIGKLVDTIITRYREVRKDCGIPDNGWHSRTIERMATPFIKGYFTLAVVGKVSSGNPHSSMLFSDVKTFFLQVMTKPLVVLHISNMARTPK